jgi:hypothetical protein
LRMILKRQLETFAAVQRGTGDQQSLTMRGPRIRHCARPVIDWC